MMKPQDLMVGDLISMGGVIRVVTGIHDKETENGVDLITTMIPGHTFPDSNLSFRASYCYPIPITPEILKKNGFLKIKSMTHSLGESWVWHEKVTGRVYTKSVEITFYKEPINGVSHLTWIETCSKKGEGVDHIHSCDIDFIHELQHALRLCGIDKEIVL